MDHLNYYEEKKFCPSCDDYVRYLMSVNSSYCVRCGNKVHLFNSRDKSAFLGALKSDKAKRNEKKRVS